MLSNSKQRAVAQAVFNTGYDAWHLPAIPFLEKLRQEDCDSEDSLDCSTCKPTVTKSGCSFEKTFSV